VFQLLVYPPTDHRARVETSLPGTFDGADATSCWSHYLGDAQGDDPRASPLRAGDFRLLPPAIVIAAEHDPLREEIELYARTLAEAGVETERGGRAFKDLDIAVIVTRPRANQVGLRVELQETPRRSGASLPG
jgi:acetyl esterase/lipase